MQQAEQPTNKREERRRHPRFEVEEQAHLQVISQDVAVPCQIVDLSSGGCRVRLKERFAAGSLTRVEISFRIRGFTFRLAGVIQWVGGRDLLGICFNEMPERRRQELAEAIGEVEQIAQAKAEQETARTRAQKQAAVIAPAEQLAQTVPPSTLARRERRTQSRHEVDTRAVILLVHVGSNLGGRIVDLSLGGCRIRTDERFPVGIYTRVEVEFRLEGLPFRLGGVVQAIHDRQTVGIRFLDVSQRKHEQVEQLIAEIQEMRKRQGQETREQGLGSRD
jgi:c-di-GMP-binding flagellar brake protein YcgR